MQMRKPGGVDIWGEWVPGIASVYLSWNKVSTPGT